MASRTHAGWDALHDTNNRNRIEEKVRRGCEAPSLMAAPVRTNTSESSDRHPRTTFAAVIVNVNKRSVSADARTFTPNYLLGVDLFISKRTVEG